MTRRACECCDNQFTPAEDEDRFCCVGCERTAAEGRRLRRGGPTFNPREPLTHVQFSAILKHFVASLDGFAAELDRDELRAESRGLLALAHDLTDMKNRVRDVAQDTRHVLAQLPAKIAAQSRGPTTEEETA